jgi:hypothetical protein
MFVYVREGKRRERRETEREKGGERCTRGAVTERG